MRDKETVLTEIRIVKGEINLEKVNNYNHMNWNKYNRLVLKLNVLQEEFRDLN